MITAVAAGAIPKSSAMDVVAVTMMVASTLPRKKAAATTSAAPRAKPDSIRSRPAPLLLPTAAGTARRRSSVLHRPCRQSARDVALEDHEDDDDRDRHDGRGRHERSPLGPVLTDERVERNRHRLELLLRREGEAEDELAPGHDEGDHAHRDEPGAHERQDDPEERLEA